MRAPALIEAKRGAALSESRLYRLSHGFGLSHQKAHRDYGPPERIGERAGVKAGWPFTAADARIKLRELYPTIDA